MYAHAHDIFISENSAYSFRRFLDPLKSNPRSRFLVSKFHSQLLSYVTHTYTHPYVMSWAGRRVMWQGGKNYLIINIRKCVKYRMNIVNYCIYWNWNSKEILGICWEPKEGQCGPTYLQTHTKTEYRKLSSYIETTGSVTQSCLTLCDPMDCSPPGSFVHGFSRQELGCLQWAAVSFSKNDKSSHKLDKQIHKALWGEKDVTKHLFHVSVSKAGVNGQNVFQQDFPHCSQLWLT